MAKLDHVKAFIDEAEKVGQAAADAVLEDTGSCNSDHICLHMPRMREKSLRDAGINAVKGRFAGDFHLFASFGVCSKNTAGVEAMAAHLAKSGVRCHVRYVMD